MIANLAGAFVLLFLLPCAAALAWWSLQDRPAMWNAADWSSSGLLAAAPPGPAIHVLAARTGGLKGAVSVHTWIAYRREGGPWIRWDVVGWGAPVRRDAWPADGRWYSNEPWTVGSVTGAEAERLIPAVEAAVAAYPWSARGDYRLWPGPNSNSFTAYVLRAVPELGAQLPPHAVGKDWLGSGLRAERDPGGDLHLSLWGLAGFAAGPRTGLEVQLLGQTFGIDLARPALKLPGVGRVGPPFDASISALAAPGG